MSSFKFPPPPPPPPKPSSNAQPNVSQRGGHSRGGSDRGRGRGGGAQARGGGFHSSGGSARGGHGHSNGRSDARGRGGARGGQRGGQRGGHQNNRGGGNHRGGSNASHEQHQTNAPQNTPATNAYANPPFAGQSAPQDQAQQPFAPNTLAQVMSLMSTPVGMQSMAAFANHMTGTGDAAPSYPPPTPQQHQPSPRYSPPQHAGQKRKLNDRGHNAQSQYKQPQQSSKPPKAKAAVPPRIPSFGFSLPPVAPVKQDNKKRKVNLGLSQQAVPDESSEEEDVDEEAEYAKKLKGGGFAFEHEGEMITIRTAGEVASWIKDRRRNFPTEKRIMEKAEEAAKKRINELDFLRRLQGKPPKEHTVEVQSKPTKTRERTKENVKRQEQEKRRQEELAALRKKLHESMLEKKAAPSKVDLGVGYDSETESDEESSVLSDSSVVSSSEDEEESESESESDAAPESTCSKVAPPPIKVPPPAPAPAPKSESICTNWKRSGRCPYLYKCKYAHPPKEEPKHMGLYERMVEQELVKADQLALDAIKYLGQHGFLG